MTAGGLSGRLKEAMERLGYKKQYEMALALGISKPYLNEIIQGKKIPSDIVLNMIEIKLAVRSEWLLEGVGEMFLSKEEWEKVVPYPLLGPMYITGELKKRQTTPESVYPLGTAKRDGNAGICETEGGYRAQKMDEFVYIPQVSGKISAGQGVIPENEVELRVAFRKDWIKRKGDPAKMVLIKVDGDSMEPTLLSGDMVLVDRNRNYISPEGGIYAIALDDTIMVKRVQALMDTVRVISDNQKYPAFEVPSDKIKVNGKVIWYAREIEK